MVDRLPTKRLLKHGPSIEEACLERCSGTFVDYTYQRVSRAWTPTTAPPCKGQLIQTASDWMAFVRWFWMCSGASRESFVPAMVQWTLDLENLAIAGGYVWWHRTSWFMWSIVWLCTTYSCTIACRRSCLLCWSRMDSWDCSNNTVTHCFRNCLKPSVTVFHACVLRFWIVNGNWSRWWQIQSTPDPS